MPHGRGNGRRFDDRPGRRTFPSRAALCLKTISATNTTARRNLTNNQGSFISRRRMGERLRDPSLSSPTAQELALATLSRPRRRMGERLRHPSPFPPPPKKSASRRSIFPHRRMGERLRDPSPFPPATRYEDLFRPRTDTSASKPAPQQRAQHPGCRRRGPRFAITESLRPHIRLPDPF
jgi:hypothetical protein